MYLALKNINKSFGQLKVLENLNMKIKEGEITCILGPSGCGKTTLLNLISGVLKPDSGSLSGFQNISASYLFQEHRLLPWKTVEGNVQFVLKDKFPSKTRKEIAEKYIRMVEMQAFAKYYPHQLSGGMKQRVSIARAFAYPADILLMDEPFKGLDPGLKDLVISSLVNLWREDKRTIIFVTHDIREALALGNEIYVLSGLPTGVKNRTRISTFQGERDLKDSYYQIKEKEIREMVDPIWAA